MSNLRAKRELLAAALLERQTRAKRNRLSLMFPGETALAPDGHVYHARGLYAKHMEFFRLGATEWERAFIAGNRVGKTFGAGGYETALHLTGRYPDWWSGRRFDKPIDALVAGITTDETRDVIQHVLVGPPEDRAAWGTGLIPHDALRRTQQGEVDASVKRGVADALDVVQVRHVSGGWSRLQFRASDQGREKFQGTARDLVWFDEEPTMAVYGEGRMRVMTKKGLIICTFTPLKGLSEVALTFLPHIAPGAA